MPPSRRGELETGLDCFRCFWNSSRTNDLDRSGRRAGWAIRMATRASFDVELPAPVQATPRITSGLLRLYLLALLTAGAGTYGPSSGNTA